MENYQNNLGFNNESNNSEMDGALTKLPFEKEGQFSQMVDSELIPESDVMPDFDDDEEEAVEAVFDIIVDEVQRKLVYVIQKTKYIMCDEIGVRSISKNLDTQAMIIKFYHRTINNVGEFEGDLTCLQHTKISRFLTSKGIIVHAQFTKIIADYLVSQVSAFVDSGKISYIHERVGFIDEANYKKGFLASKSIGAAYNSTMVNNPYKILGPNGDRTIYDDMIQKEVIPNKSLHLPLVLGFTAPLVPIMYDKTACPVLMTNFAGKSSHGKSTSLMLIASIWGKGFISNTRLAITKTFTSTQNGFEATVNKNNGLPVLYDDYETAPKNTIFSQLIYTLAQGESKTRCDKTGRVVDTFQWRTYIGFSGESSIFNRAGHNLGLKPRIVEFMNTKWTVSKENSTNITGTIINNYGFYGEEFVEKLMGFSKVTLDSIYKNCEKVINKLVPPKDNISDRIQTRLALIRMTAILVKKLMNLDIDVDYVTDVLVKNEKARQENLDIYQLAAESVVEFVNTNLSSFVRTIAHRGEAVIPNSKIVGRIYNGAHGHLVAIMPYYFNKFIMGAFNDKESILEKWRKDDFLLTDKGGRYTKKVRISSIANPTGCYVIVFDRLCESFKKHLDEDILEIQEIEHEDNANRISRNKPKIIFKDGEEYVNKSMLLGDAKDDEILLNNSIILGDYKRADLTQPEIEILTELKEITYEEETDIDKIFGNEPEEKSDEKTDDNDK